VFSPVGTGENFLIFRKIIGDNMDMHCEMIMEEFFDNQPTFEAIKKYTLDKIDNLLTENKILVTALEGRIKTEHSLAGKLELKGQKYASLMDITDIVGCRVITFYADEVDKIAALIEQNFEIDWENSVDKRKLHDPDQFGYMSLHYICRIPKEKYSDPSLYGLNDYRFEIQMRTALQHVWATAYHDTGYKSDVEVPKEYIRSLSRLAGVLEIADKEFSSIIRELADYRRKVIELVKGGNFSDLYLDMDTFKNYLELRPFKPLNDRIAAINRAEVQEQSHLPYLAILKEFGFKTLKDVEDLKNNYTDDAYRLALMQMGGTDIDIFMSTVAIQNLVTVYIIKNGMGEAGLKKFYTMLYGERTRNAAAAKELMEKAKKLNIITE